MSRLYICKIVLLTGLALFSASGLAIITDDFSFPESDKFVKNDLLKQYTCLIQDLKVYSIQNIFLLGNELHRKGSDAYMKINKVAFLDDENRCLIYEESKHLVRGCDDEEHHELISLQKGTQDLDGIIDNIIGISEKVILVVSAVTFVSILASLGLSASVVAGLGTSAVLTSKAVVAAGKIASKTFQVSTLIVVPATVIGGLEVIDNMVPVFSSEECSGLSLQY